MASALVRGVSELEPGIASMLSSMKTPADQSCAALYRAHNPIKAALALQCAYVARCCQQVHDTAAERIVEHYRYTWEKRLADFRKRPDGSLTAPASSHPAAAPLLQIGVIGCGMVGRDLVFMLLDSGIAPDQIAISTRSPQRLQELAALGVRCVFDNEGVASRCHLLILAVLPAQLPEVAKQLYGRLPRRSLALSIVAAVPSQKLQSMLGSPHALQVSAASAPLRALLRAAQSSSSAGAPQLPGSALLHLAACSLLADVRSTAALSTALAGLLGGLELTDADVVAICVGCLCEGADEELICSAFGDPNGAGAAAGAAEMQRCFRLKLEALPKVTEAHANLKATANAEMSAEISEILGAEKREARSEESESSPGSVLGS